MSDGGASTPAEECVPSALRRRQDSDGASGAASSDWDPQRVATPVLSSFGSALAGGGVPAAQQPAAAQQRSPAARGWRDRAVAMFSPSSAARRRGGSGAAAAAGQAPPPNFQSPRAATPRTMQHRKLTERVRDILQGVTHRDAPPELDGVPQIVQRRRNSAVVSPDAEGRRDRPRRSVSFDHVPRQRGQWGVAAPGGASPGTGAAVQPPPRRVSRDGSFNHAVEKASRAVGLKKSALIDGRTAPPLTPAATGSYLIVADMDRLLLAPAPPGSVGPAVPRPLPGAAEAVHTIAQLGCELVLWTALAPEAAAAAGAALRCGDETRIVHSHVAWFQERLLNGRLVYTRPSLLSAQQAARSDSLEHVLVFDARMDVVRGYRQNCVLVDAVSSRSEWVAPSVAGVVVRLVRMHLAVPEFLASSHAQDLLARERRPPLSSAARPADCSPPPPVPVPVLRPTAALAAAASGGGRAAAPGAPPGFNPADGVRRVPSAGKRYHAARFLSATGEQLDAIGHRPDATEGLLLGDPIPLPPLIWPKR